VALPLAVAALPCLSCLIDSEAVACDDDGLPVFDRLRYRRHDRTPQADRGAGRRLLHNFASAEA
jgi:ATP-dependent DNA ligase